MYKLLTLAGVLVGLYTASCSDAHASSEHEGGHPAPEMTFTVTKPVQVDTQVIKSYVAQVQSIRHIEVRALEKGYLQKVYIDEGQYVREGQLMFQITPTLYQAEVGKSKAEANFAEIEYQNTKRLADGNIVSAGELAMAKAKLDKALAELEIANVHLRFTEIRAPFSGIVDRFQVKLGSLVDEGELITNLSDNSKMWVYYNVPEAEYLDYMATASAKTKPHVNLLMANNKLFGHPGIVETIEADFDNETGNIPFRATFPNPKGLLRHGETGNIEMAIPLKDAIIVPQKVTYEVLSKKYVYVVDADDVVHAREIEVLNELEDLFVVKGIAADETILLEGIRKVQDQDKIKHRFVDPQLVMRGLELPAQ